MQSRKGLYAIRVMSTTSVARWGMLRAHPVDEEESINSGSGRKNGGKRKPDNFFGKPQPGTEGDNPEVGADAHSSVQVSIFRLILY